MHRWVLMFAMLALANGETPPKHHRDLRLQSGPEGSHWFQRPSSDPHSHVTRGSTHKTTETSPDHPGFTASSPERWRPKANFTNLGYYGYPKLQTGNTRSPYQYLLTRPDVKTMHLPKGKIRYQSYDPSGKIRHPPIAYKKTYKPHKATYPVQKIVIPSRYYQSPYQRYSIPMSDALRHGLDGRRGHPTSSTPPTTERMDDTYPEGSSSYGGEYEEPEKSSTGIGDTSYDETATRGYYGDRIYMSTQSPLILDPDQTSIKNKYFVIKKISHGDDLETIFE